LGAALMYVGSSTGADWMSTWNTYAERCTEKNDTSEHDEWDSVKQSREIRLELKRRMIAPTKGHSRKPSCLSFAIYAWGDEV
jgi:hypothetical protein